MKALIGKMFSERMMGAIDFVRFPKMRAAWGGPFNGQHLRQDMFRSIVDVFKPLAIIEAGTYLGTTTEFLADTNLPVYSIEADPRTYSYARVRLWRRTNVKLTFGDSRGALRALLAGPLRHLSKANLFFYLDAHWDKDLPLLEELEIIFNRCSSTLVMVDDFEVPDEPGYGYDDYGPGKALTLNYIKPAIEKHQLTIYFPSAPAREEGGKRRGCIVLAQGKLLDPTITGLRVMPVGQVNT
jgi:predicted O-methyltransferase YrrM